MNIKSKQLEDNIIANKKICLKNCSTILKRIINKEKGYIKQANLILKIHLRN